MLRAYRGLHRVGTTRRRHRRRTPTRPASTLPARRTPSAAGLRNRPRRIRRPRSRRTAPLPTDAVIRSAPARPDRRPAVHRLAVDVNNARSRWLALLLEVRRSPPPRRLDVDPSSTMHTTPDHRGATPSSSTSEAPSPPSTPKRPHTRDATSPTNSTSTPSGNDTSRSPPPNPPGHETSSPPSHRATQASTSTSSTATDQHRTAEAFTPTAYARLTQLQQQLDPDNLLAARAPTFNAPASSQQR